MQLVYGWVHLVIWYLDLSKRHLKGGIRYSSLASLFALSLLLTGCSTPRHAVYTEISPPLLSDPFEPMNRIIFGLNEGLARFLIRPVAVVYA